MYLIISDTHDSLESINMLSECVKGSNNLKLIHLGDIVSPFTLKFIVSRFKVETVVLGNNDGDKLLLNTIFKVHEQPVELYINGLKALLLHGFGSKELTLRIIRALALSSDYDIILFGHTHEYYAEVIRNTLVLNPGTLAGYLSKERTYAILDPASLHAKIMKVDNCMPLIDVKVPLRKNR